MVDVWDIFMVIFAVEIFFMASTLFYMMAHFNKKIKTAWHIYIFIILYIPEVFSRTFLKFQNWIEVKDD